MHLVGKNRIIFCPGLPGEYLWTRSGRLSGRALCFPQTTLFPVEKDLNQDDPSYLPHPGCRPAGLNPAKDHRGSASCYYVTYFCDWFRRQGYPAKKVSNSFKVSAEVRISLTISPLCKTTIRSHTSVTWMRS